MEEFNWVNVIVADLLKTQELSGIEIYSPTFVVSSGDPRQMIENEAKVCKFIRISQKMYQPSEIKDFNFKIDFKYSFDTYLENVGTNKQIVSKNTKMDTPMKQI